MSDEADPLPEPEASARLVAGIGAGDRGAEQTMFERYGNGVLYLLKRHGADPDLALDLRQDVFAIAIEKLRQTPLDDTAKLAAFLRGIALNVLTAHRRKAQRRATYTNSDTIDSAPDERSGPYDRVSDQQLQAAVRGLLDELKTPRDREILTRVYLQEHDRDAICADMGIDAAHFSRVLFRAKQRFKALLTQAQRRDRLRIVG